MEPLSYDDLMRTARATDRQLVTVERHPGYAIVRMDDPAHLNALNLPLSVQLHDRLTELAGDPQLRAVILTGTDPAFSAGGDLHTMEAIVHPLVDQSPEGATSMWRWIRYQFGGVVRLIAHTDKAFVAAVNGAAAGVGLAFALACDMVIASEQARLVLAFGRIGLLPEVGTSWLLTRRLGYHRTFELFVGGKTLAAREAEQLGLVNEVVPHGEEVAKARAWCERICQLPEHALIMTKPLLRGAADMTWEQAITMEEFAEPMCFTTQAHRAAVRSKIEKR